MCWKGTYRSRKLSPATLADLYDTQKMPKDLKEAHICNDEAVDRIFVGRQFRNDTERLKKLFDLYHKMTKNILVN